MKKIPCLFQRKFCDDTFELLKSVTPDCEWVLDGEGQASIKVDGTACAIIDGKLYARYDCKPTRQAKKNHIPNTLWNHNNFRDSPSNSIPCQEPDLITGHWPHWVLVEDQPEYKYHREGWLNFLATLDKTNCFQNIDGTYELIGPKIGGNPEESPIHLLIKHGTEVVNDIVPTFNGIKEWLTENVVEGLVFTHSDGRMCKIRRRDYDLQWPL